MRILFNIDFLVFAIGLNNVSFFRPDSQGEPPRSLFDYVFFKTVRDNAQNALNTALQKFSVQIFFGNFEIARPFGKASAKTGKGLYEMPDI